MTEHEGGGKLITPIELFEHFEMVVGPQVRALVESRFTGSAESLLNVEKTGFKKKDIPLGPEKFADIEYVPKPVLRHTTNWWQSGAITLRDESLQKERTGRVEYYFGHEIYSGIEEPQVRKYTFDLEGRVVGRRVIDPSDQDELQKVKKLLSDVELGLHAERSRN